MKAVDRIGKTITEALPQAAMSLAGSRLVQKPIAKAAESGFTKFLNMARKYASGALETFESGGMNLLKMAGKAVPFLEEAAPAAALLL